MNRDRPVLLRRIVILKKSSKECGGGCRAGTVGGLLQPVRFSTADIKLEVENGQWAGCSTELQWAGPRGRPARAMGYGTGRPLAPRAPRSRGSETRGACPARPPGTPVHRPPGRAVYRLPPRALVWSGSRKPASPSPAPPARAHRLQPRTSLSLAELPTAPTPIHRCALSFFSNSDFMMCTSFLLTPIS